MAGKFACPNCGSEQIQKCSVIYQQGTVDHSYTSRSGDDSVETTGTESTGLAQSVAPPAKKDTSWGFMIVLAFFSFASFCDDYFWLGIILGVLAAATFMMNKEAMDYNSNQWPRDYRQWQDSWFCHKCGHRFVMK